MLASGSPGDWWPLALTRAVLLTAGLWCLPETAMMFAGLWCLPASVLMTAGLDCFPEAALMSVGPFVAFPSQS